MRNRYFVTTKWVHDPAARRRSQRANLILRGVHDHIFNTSTTENGLDMDHDSWRALEIVDRASRAVAAAEIDAHREARLRDEGVIGGRL